MFSLKKWPLALCATAAGMLSSVLCNSVYAADDSQLQQLRSEIEKLRQTYEARLQALETRLQNAQQATQATPTAEAPLAPVTGQANAFNPAISVVLSGVYANLSQDPANYAISNFISGGEIGPGKRGFSLAESEVGLSASIDSWLYGNLTMAFTPENEAEVEEAFVQTTALPHGVSLKAGRFFSSIGYLNEKHAHVWDFVDSPLAYQAFLGGQLKDDGVQFKWLLPTPMFVELSAEVGRGRNFPGSDQEKNGSGAYTFAAHTGGDITANQNWRAGISYLRADAKDRAYDTTDVNGNAVSNGFSGKSRLWLADFVWKWAPTGNAASSHVKLQGEYFRRKESGVLAYDTAATNSIDDYSSSQSGWYLQSVYQFMPTWRVGLRYDRLNSGRVDYASNSANLANSNFNPRKNSVMLDYNPSEFSRVRLQVARDQSREGVSDTQMFVQYIMSLGAHGAHSY